MSSLAPHPADFTTTQSNESAALALGYIALNGTGSPEGFADYMTYYSNLKVVFHNTLEQNADKLNTAILERIDADYGCSADIDPEVRQRWFAMGLALYYEPVYDPAHEWISSMGRSKYLTPVYDALENSGQHDLCVQWYNENKNFYHPVAATTVAKDCNITTEKEFEQVTLAIE